MSKHQNFIIKRMKFVPELIEDVKSGKKTKTWRLFDDKDLQNNDKLELFNAKTNKPFAKAIILMVKETTFNDLTEEDKQGHESFTSTEIMLKTYSEYYKREVTLNTSLKIIEFQVVKEFGRN